MNERVPVEVKEAGVERGFWEFEVQTVAAHREYVLRLHSDDGRMWSATGSNVFGCLLELRQELERASIALACKGSREDTWASGMQVDMGQGLVVYLLSDVQSGERPPEVRTLEPADWDRIATVAQQTAWHEAWISQRRQDGNH